VYVGAGLPEHGVLFEEQLPHLMWEKNTITFTIMKSGGKVQPARIFSRENISTVLEKTLLFANAKLYLDNFMKMLKFVFKGSFSKMDIS
jgi:hypothetical protein